MNFLKKLFGLSDKAGEQPEVNEPPEPQCPYCGYIFEEHPTRKRKCPKCEETIYLIKDEGNEFKSLVTKEYFTNYQKAIEEEKAEKKRLGEEWRKERVRTEEWEDVIVGQGDIFRIAEDVDWDDVDNFQQKYLKRPLGDRRTLDEFWGNLNKYNLGFATKADHYMLSFVYQQQARILRFEGKDDNKIIELAEKHERLNDPDGYVPISAESEDTSVPRNNLSAEDLEREGKLGEAKELCYKMVEKTEKEADIMQWGVAPFAYYRIAIICRKEKNYQEEVEILERYDRQVKAPGSMPEQLAKRLNRAKELLTKNQ